MNWYACPKCKQSATGVYDGWITCIRCERVEVKGTTIVVRPMFIARIECPRP